MVKIFELKYNKNTSSIESLSGIALLQIQAHLLSWRTTTVILEPAFHENGPDRHEFNLFPANI